MSERKLPNGESILKKSEIIFTTEDVKQLKTRHIIYKTFEGSEINSQIERNVKSLAVHGGPLLNVVERQTFENGKVVVGFVRLGLETIRKVNRYIEASYTHS